MREYYSSADDIFNADETRIFYRMIPDKTHRMKAATNPNGKWFKERIKVMA